MRTVIGATLIGLILVVPGVRAQSCPPAEPVANEVCEAAIPLGTNPVALTLEGNTALAVHDYDIGHDNPCTGARSDGPDVVYSVVLGPECVMTATLSLCDPHFWYDQSLYIVADCVDLLADCAGSDQPCIDEDCPVEQATFSNTSSQPRTVYIVLDGKFPSAGGAWNLDLSTDCVVPVDATTWGAIKATYR
jgi:hypothetical protein